MPATRSRSRTSQSRWRWCWRRPGLSERDVPDYIEVNHTKMTAKLVRIPHLTEVPYPVQMEPHLVVEFYSR